MKFIIRDDDINYHYKSSQLSEWYSGIIDVCPISICIPAFIKGDFFHWNYLAEKRLFSDVNEWLKDDKVYPIGENIELVDYLKSLLNKGQIGISMHGISHRNDEMELKEVKNNHIRGAELYTNRDYTKSLHDAKEYLSELFGVNVISITPPQNMININGLKAIINNRLSLCTDFISFRNLKACIKLYGIFNSIVLLCYRFFSSHRYPYVIRNVIGFVGHTRLQPGNDIEEIKREFDYAYKRNGIFVLSTHSYAFGFKMEKYNMNMKEALLDILYYSQQFENVEYTTLHELFSIK